MKHMIGHALMGLLTGMVARILLPGHEPYGIIVTALVGMAGGWLGGFLGQALGWYRSGQPAGCLMSVLGAMLLFIAMRFL